MVKKITTPQTRIMVISAEVFIYLLLKIDTS